jgi:hypothetical protein
MFTGTVLAIFLVPVFFVVVRTLFKSSSPQPRPELGIRAAGDTLPTS